MNKKTTPLEVSPRDYHTRLQCNRENIFDPDSFLSKSVIWELQDSSLYRWRFAPKDQSKVAEKKCVQDGSIIDTLITTPDELDEVAAVHSFESFRSKEAREFRDEAIAEGRVPNHEKDLGEARKAARAYFTDPVIGPIVKDARKQVVCIGEVCEIQSKCLIDIAPDDGPVLWDIKRTARLNKSALEKTLATFGYHVQAAWYLHLWNQQHPDRPKDRFGFLWQLSEPPYELVATELPAFDIAAGEDWIRYQCERLKTATEKNLWPGLFDDQITMLGRPAWAGMKDEEMIEEPVLAPGTNAA